MPRRFTLVHEYSTPRTVYATTFSPDGDQLAYGGGFFYGEGFVSVVGKSGEGDALWHQEHEATFSALCFDRSARFVAASVWASRHSYHPTAILRWDGSAPTWLEDNGKAEYRYCATGILARGRTLAVRHGASLERPVSFHALPDDFVAADQPQLTSSRVVAFGDLVATGVGSTWRGLDGGKEVARLTLTELRGTAMAITRSIEAPHSATISAIAADEARRAMVTGGADGSVVFWELPKGGDSADPVVRSVVRLHAHEVSAACFLADGTVATADRRGLLQVWKDGVPIASWTANGWSPRALAAHPRRPRLALGCKHGPDGGFEGLVAVLDIEA